MVLNFLFIFIWYRFESYYREVTYSQRGDADTNYEILTSFEFVFILHLMKQTMGNTDKLCEALQHSSQDILNAMEQVSTTKLVLQKLRDRWMELNLIV